MAKPAYFWYFAYQIQNQSQFTHDRDISDLNIDLIQRHTAYFQICQLHALWQKPHTSQILHTKIQNHSQFTHDRDISALNIELIPEHTRHPKFVNNMLYAKIRILPIFCILKFKISHSSHMTEALALQTSTSYQCILHTPKFVNYMLFGQTRKSSHPLHTKIKISRNSCIIETLVL